MTLLQAGEVLALGVLAYVVLHLLYELTINRGKTPTLTLNLFAQRAIAHYVRTHVTGRVVDLGSGYGGLARRIARTAPAVQVTGIEWARLPLYWARLWQRLLGPANLAFVRGDLMDYDCRGVDAVVLFLSPAMMDAVAHKLRAELAPGATVISACFPLPGWQPAKTISVRWSFGVKVYIYHLS